MDRRLAAVALAVLLAGCSAFAGGGEPTETVTPAPVPEVTPGERGGTALPPGVTAEGVVDPAALADAHLNAVENRSYVMRGRFVYGNQTSAALLRVASPRRYYYRETNGYYGSNVTEFADGEWWYGRYDRFQSRYSRDRATDATERFGAIVTQYVDQYLAGDATVTEATVDGQRRFVIRSSDQPWNRTAVEDYSARALVTPDGVIRSLRVSFVDRDGDDELRVEQQLSYERRDVTVERPEWVDEQWGDDRDGDARDVGGADVDPRDTEHTSSPVTVS